MSSDYSEFDFNSIVNNEFAVRATGGVRLVTEIDGSGTPTATHSFTDVLMQLPTIASASLPSANTVQGAIASTTDGGTGSIPALLYSNGTSWIVIGE